jgi:hypothetical protein
MSRIAAYQLRYLIAIDARMPDAVRPSFDFGVVCLWAIAGLTLTAIAIALGWGGQSGELL